MSTHYEMDVRRAEDGPAPAHWATRSDSRDFASPRQFMQDAEDWYEVNSHNHYAEIFAVEERGGTSVRTLVRNWNDLRDLLSRHPG